MVRVKLESLSQLDDFFYFQQVSWFISLFFSFFFWLVLLQRKKWWWIQCKQYLLHSPQRSWQSWGNAWWSTRSTWNASHNIQRTAQSHIIENLKLLFLFSEPLHVPAHPVLHLAVLEGHHQLSSHCFPGLLDSPAAGSTFNLTFRCHFFNPLQMHFPFVHKPADYIYPNSSFTFGCLFVF